ncbi:UNVERIFIED_CONTAM: hypothetical protein FKN15_071738 [Acipenser sinensis]
MSASPVCCGSHLATRSSATPDIRDWTIARLQLYLRSNNIPLKSTARVQQAPVVTALATMGVQQAAIVLPSHPTITFLVTSPHCRDQQYALNTSEVQHAENQNLMAS